MPMTATRTVKIPEELLARIDDWRRKQPVVTTQAEAIVLLAEIGLEAPGQTASVAEIDPEHWKPKP